MSEKEEEKRETGGLVGFIVWLVIFLLALYLFFARRRPEKSGLRNLGAFLSAFFISFFYIGYCIFTGWTSG